MRAEDLKGWLAAAKRDGTERKNRSRTAETGSFHAPGPKVLSGGKTDLGEKDQT